MATLRGEPVRKALHIALVSGLSVVLIAWGVNVFGRLLAEQERESEPVARPNNGTYVEFYPDGSIYSEQHYLQGMRVGTWVTYYPNGSLQRIQHFDEDREVGRSSYYHISGQLMYQVQYEKGWASDTVVVDDSLYRYSVLLLDHGKGLFKRVCGLCHQPSDAPKLETALQSWVELVDSLGLDSLALDSLHRVRIDSMIERARQKDIKVPPLDTSRLHPLDRYDVDAVRQYLQRSERETNNPASRWLRYIRIRPKIVGPTRKPGGPGYDNS